MVTLSEEGLYAYLSPYKPTQKSSTLVITLPKRFRDLMQIEAGTQLVIQLLKNPSGSYGMLISKVIKAEKETPT